MQKQNPRSEDTGLRRAAALKKSKKLGSEAQRAGSNVLFNQEGGGQTAGGGGASMHWFSTHWDAWALSRICVYHDVCSFHSTFLLGNTLPPQPHSSHLFHAGVVSLQALARAEKLRHWRANHRPWDICSLALLLASADQACPSYESNSKTTHFS